MQCYADIDVTSWYRYLHISTISSIPVIGILLFYTCDIGSSVGQYFRNDTGLQVEYIPENILFLRLHLFSRLYFFRCYIVSEVTFVSEVILFPRLYCLRGYIVFEVIFFPRLYLFPRTIHWNILPRLIFSSSSASSISV